MTLIADLKVAARSLDVFRTVSRANGFDPTPADILTGHQTCIADTDEDAREQMRRGLDYFNTMLMQSLREAQRLVIQKTRFFSNERQSQGFVNKLQTLRQTPVEELIESGSILCGSPASVVKQIRRIHGELGNGHMQLNMKIGDMPDTVVRRSMELFRDSVRPELGDL